MATITADSVLEALSRHIGRANGARAAELVREVTGALAPDPVAERRLRQVITELRLRGEHVCATPRDGYFMAATDRELDETCEFLHDRALAGLAQIARMKRISLPDLRGQLKLPT